jgi:hypothetical protein
LLIIVIPLWKFEFGQAYSSHKPCVLKIPTIIKVQTSKDGKE